MEWKKNKNHYNSSSFFSETNCEALHTHMPFFKNQDFFFYTLHIKKNTTCTRFDYYATQLKSSRIRMKSTKW